MTSLNANTATAARTAAAVNAGVAFAVVNTGFTGIIAA